MKLKLHSVCLLSLIAFFFGSSTAFISADDHGEITVKKNGKKVTVKIDGKLFTEYLFEGNNKPILYPIIGPGEVPMTRNYPMKKDVPNEASDHPHHRSLWFTHGAVNNISFWHEGKNAGTQVHSGFEKLAGGKKGIIKTKNLWKGPKGNTVLTDVRTITISKDGDSRVIDYEVTMHASNGKVVLGDTKEGTMGIRTNSLLRLKKDDRRGVKKVTGKALNSGGQKDRSLWGKRAAWVDYWGEVDGKTVGIAIFDHPKNPRHPTWWHARDYGLVAANPFGVHDFERKKPGTGDMTIEDGKKITFKYRFIFHKGNADQAKIGEKYKSFAKDK